MDSLAERTRRAVREHPFLVDALRAGVCNYAAAARYLDVEGDPEAVATALRRYADELPTLEFGERRAVVSMRSGLGEADDAGEAVLAVGDRTYAPDAGSLTGVLAVGDVDVATLGDVLGRLDVAGVAPEAAGVAGESLVVVVDRRGAATAVRVVEDALESVREPTDDA